MADVTDVSFEADVIERSKTVPVVVDLWAPWCGPCKTLGPILDKVIGATGGRVELAKVNVDENPAVSQAFKVQSIPAVYAMRDGQVVDGFMGAQAEAEVQRFVDGLYDADAPAPDGTADEAAGAPAPDGTADGDDGATMSEPEAPADPIEAFLAVGDAESLSKALALAPEDPRVVAAAAEMLVEEGRTDDALALLAKIPETAETRRVAALARTGGGGTDEIEAKLEALLLKVKGDDEARQEFIDLLEVMGPEDPRTAAFRKRLTSALY